MSKIKKEIIKAITEQVGMPEFEYNVYESTPDDLQTFAEKIIELYESDDYDDALED